MRFYEPILTGSQQILLSWGLGTNSQQANPAFLTYWPKPNKPVTRGNKHGCARLDERE